MKANIIRISDEILSELLKFRKIHPEFTFALRERDSALSSENRLQSGQWFQGGDYIYVPLFNKGDSSRRIKTFGFVLNFQNDTIIDNYIEISFKGGVERQSEIEFHKELAQRLGLKLNINNHGTKSYRNPEKYLDNLRDFLESTYPIAIELVNKYNLNEEYIVSSQVFEKRLAKIIKIKERHLPTKTTKSETSESSLMIPLNQILFGPPGTGKTYNTINKAIAIANPEFDLNQKRDLVKSEYDRLISEGQIMFTTFHQSMSYEDFIEGIKPSTSNSGDKQISFDVKKGLFKIISENALSNLIKSKKENENQLDFEEAFENLKDEWFRDNNIQFELRTEGYAFTIIGFNNTSIQFKKSSGNTDHTLSINTLRQIYYGKQINFNTGINIYYLPILQKLKRNILSEKTVTKRQNFVLIIDEINRGNVSQIFGELITLIEDDKRIGRKEELRIHLPYSQDEFGVPENLYIIGTMNTADRSVEALDAALRRRFSFVEMPPINYLLKTEKLFYDLWMEYDGQGWEEPWKSVEKSFFELFNGDKLVSEEEYRKLDFDSEKVWYEKVESERIVKFNGLKLDILLEILNKRIEKLLNKEYQIGHAYFMSVFSWADLKYVFFNKIIPLLQEYFYGDYAKIGLVLGSGFVKKEEDKILFANFDHEYKDDLASKPIWSIVPETEFESDQKFQDALKLLVKAN